MASAIVDCDVHEDVRSREEVVAYMPAAWRDFASLETVKLVDGDVAPAWNPYGYTRKDAFPPEGGPAGSSPGFMAEQLLDGVGIDYAVLTGDAMALCASSLGNPHLARQLTRALNRYRGERWLAADPRYLGTICLPLQVPEWAAEEITYWAGRDRFVQAMANSNPHSYPFGHPMFDPVHRACAEAGVPIGIHTLCQAMAGSGVSHLAGGTASYYVEFHGGAVQEVMTAIMSFIFHGVFDRYPTLRLVMLEAGGVAWIAPFLRRLDTDFKGLRGEVPWCKKLPSEYFAEHVRVATQPFDHDRADDPALSALDDFGAEEFLVFATDYPHWDADVPTRALSAMPRHWRDKVAYRNAASLYGLPKAA